MMQLLTKIKSGDDSAFEELCVEYNPLLFKIVSNFSGSLRLDFDDILQEARISLLVAARTYEENRSTTFGLWAKKIINNHMIDLLRKQKSEQKKQQSAKKIAVEQLANSSRKAENPQFTKAMLEPYLASLSNLELQVVQLYIGGNSYAKIATALNCEIKSVDNAMTRIRKKVRGGNK